MLENRVSGGKLAVKRKKPQQSSTRKISFEADLQSKPIIMTQEYFKNDSAEAELKQQFKLAIDTEKEENIQCLWELQKQ